MIFLASETKKQNKAAEKGMKAVNVVASSNSTLILLFIDNTGLIVGMVVLVVALLLAAGAFGLFKARSSDKSKDEEESPEKDGDAVEDNG